MWKKSFFHHFLASSEIFQMLVEAYGSQLRIVLLYFGGMVSFYPAGSRLLYKIQNQDHVDCFFFIIITKVF